jgi:lipopolysaccharide biosynthesis glycosyltransferase
VEYLFPTVVSALQARDHARANTPVFIFLSEAFHHLDELSAFLSAREVKIIDESRFFGDRFSVFSKRKNLDGSRISVTAFGRLFLDQIAPVETAEIIYIDGDTQIVGSLDALEAFTVPPGKFLAARDYLSINQRLSTGAWGTTFNSGVLKFNRDSWIESDAFQFYLKHPERCGGYHDQGALNAFASESQLLMSSRWNFPKQYLQYIADRQPAIIHYMAHPKPWNGVYFPWGKAETAPYNQLRRLLGSSLIPISDIGFLRTALYRYRSLNQKFNHFLMPKKFPICDLFEGPYVV